jgi:hypothetical protein
MVGSQEPRIRVEPARSSTDGSDAALLMETYAKALDPWQKTVLDCWLGRSGTAYTVTSAGLSVPRQNGKNVILEARELYGMVVNGENILHTAHQVRTSKASFRRMEAIFTDRRHPELADIVSNIRYTNGEECIELDNGASIKYVARSRQAARGFAGLSLVVFDEAQELTEDQLESTLSTLAASPTGTRQVIYTGTPPYPGCPGDVFRRRRMLCCSGDPGPHDAWHEWSVEAPNLEALRIDDRVLWYEVNPSMGTHLPEEFTKEELQSMTADGFARERLGWWSPVLTEKTDYAIPADVWDRCRSEELKPEGKTAYGVVFAPDGSEVCLCGAVIPAGGPGRISLIDRRPTGLGTRWLAEWLNERYSKAACVVIDGRNGVDLLVDRITDVWRAKNSVRRPTAKDVVAAVSMLTDSLHERGVTWYAAQDALRDSAVTSTRRPIGGGWGFGGENSGPIEAAALALWGAKTSKRDPSKKMRIG